MARSYVLGPNAARELKRLIRGNGGTSRRDAVAGALAFDSDYAHPYTVQWAQSLNDGDGEWIIWLPPGHLFIDGKEVDITAAQSGGTGGMTAAGGDYPTGWYVLDLGEDYTAGDDFTLYLDVGASPPVFGISSTSMTTPVKICKVTDDGKAVVGIVESALVFASGDPIHPYKVKWFPDGNGGGQFGIHLAANYLMVGGNYITPSNLTRITTTDGESWYQLPSGFTSGTLYLNVRCWYYGNPIADAAESGSSAQAFVRRSALNASAVLADSPVNISTDADAAHQAVYSIVIAVITVPQNAPPVIAQKIKSALYLEAPIPEPVRGAFTHTAFPSTGAVVDTLVIGRDAGGKTYLNSIVAIKAGTGVTVTKVTGDAAATEMGVDYIEIAATGGGGSGGGGGGSSITLTPGSGILINDSNQAQTGTSFTIKAVYV